MNADFFPKKVLGAYTKGKIFFCYFLLLCLINAGCRTPAPVAARDGLVARTDSATLQAAPGHPELQLVAIGEVVGYNTVVVKSRVDGPIVQIAFHEGQDVKEGDLLAVIDPDNYRVAMDEAVASRDKDSATLKQAQATFARDRALYSEGIIARQDFEKQEATLHQLEGVFRADQAAVEGASLKLTYTKILAPIAGRVGLKTVDAGNIVHSDDSVGIVTITQVRPIAVIFSVPPNRLNAIMKSTRRRPIRVEAFSEDGTNFLGRGMVLTADTAIDPVTGAARIKAILPNTAEVLWPNEFVQIKLQLDTDESRTKDAN